MALFFFTYNIQSENKKKKNILGKNLQDQVFLDEIHLYKKALKNKFNLTF